MHHGSPINHGARYHGSNNVVNVVETTFDDFIDAGSTDETHKMFYENFKRDYMDEWDAERADPDYFDEKSSLESDDDDSIMEEEPSEKEEKSNDEEDFFSSFSSSSYEKNDDKEEEEEESD